MWRPGMGNEAEAAFGKAFKRRMGMAPRPAAEQRRPLR